MLSAAQPDWEACARRGKAERFWLSTSDGAEAAVYVRDDGSVSTKLAGAASALREAPPPFEAVLVQRPSPLAGVSATLRVDVPGRCGSAQPPLPSSRTYTAASAPSLVESQKRSALPRRAQASQFGCAAESMAGSISSLVAQPLNQYD
jgi:hypothetical protein